MTPTPIEYKSERFSLDDFFFPVGLHDVYFDVDRILPRHILRCPIQARHFQAVVDEERKYMLSCVSKSYSLITNESAFELGLKIAEEIFKIDDENISFWRGDFTTENRGSCWIDYEINKSLQIENVNHNWSAFVRMRNSYDKSSSLSYDVGFILETMDGAKVPIGLLVPSLSLNFIAPHNWKLDTICSRMLDAVRKKYGGFDVFKQFENMVNSLLQIEMIDDEFLPLFCRLAHIKKLQPDNEVDVENAKMLITIKKDSERWTKTCGMNAYAALCAYADFAARFADKVNFLNASSEFQSQLGKFVDELIETKSKKKEDFNLYDFIGKEAREVSKQIILICK